VISLAEMKTTSVAVAPSVAAKDYLLAVQSVLARLDHALVDRMVEVVWRGYEEGRTLFLFGNGGSAALASHFACDIGKGTIAGKRKRLKAVALTDNVALITAWANDKAYDAIFAEQLESLAEKGDIALAISGSGNSPNVIRGLEAARRLGAQTLALTGFDGGRAKPLADLCLVVPSDSMQLIEDAHLCATHAIFLAIRQRMMRTNGD
jgi:D-sedoheptulose 7-phosphate isomerase